MWYPLNVYWFRVIVSVILCGGTIYSAWQILAHGKKGLVRISICLILICTALYTFLHRILDISPTAQQQAQSTDAEKSAPPPASAPAERSGSGPATSATRPADEDTGSSSVYLVANNPPVPSSYEPVKFHLPEPGEIYQQETFTVSDGHPASVTVYTARPDLRGKIICHQDVSPQPGPNELAFKIITWVGGEHIIYSGTYGAPPPDSEEYGKALILADAFEWSTIRKGKTFTITRYFTVKPKKAWEPDYWVRNVKMKEEK